MSRMLATPFAIILLICCGQSPDEDMPGGVVQKQPTVWTHLDVTTPNAIDSFRFEVTERGAAHYNRVNSGVRLKNMLVKFDRNDKEVLKALEDRIGVDACLVPATVAGHDRFWGGGADPIGVLEISIDSKIFHVAITPVGFSHGNASPKGSTLFYSPAAADLVDLIYYANCGMGIPFDLKEALSGRRAITGLREQFRFDLLALDALRRSESR